MSLYIAGRLTPTNVSLLEACRALDHSAALLPLEDVARRARPGDVLLPRLDVLPTLDGIEPGLGLLDGLAARGVDVVNPASAIIASHDKLATALKLSAAGVRHPRTAHVDESGRIGDLRFPVVVKPRFGSWGRDVARCADELELEELLSSFRRRPWFERHGALVQELVPPRGYDVRVLVARGRVIGAIQRVAAPGEWRTNIALGGSRVACMPSSAACATAIAAADAIGAGLVGVDLLPTASGYVVIEINGCVDFTPEYGAPGVDVFAAAARALVDPVSALTALTFRLDAMPAVD
jgi:[lysine-biosynthesis-protein LysW]---L-2-aminoadipate ligase